MKTGWEYKKLGEVVSSINGLWTGKKEPFITIPVISLKNFTKDCKLKKEDYSIIDVEVRQFESRKLQYGDIIIEKSGGSDTQPVGRPILFDIKEGDYSFSNFTTTLRVNDANKELLNSLFLHNVLLAYYRQGKTFSLQSKTTGIHNLDLKGYLNLPIPVPPLPTQQSIVSELDSLSQIIADCKETLKDYDALEQSIFYDMFGDPVKNEKGWEVRLMKDVAPNVKYQKEIESFDGKFWLLNLDMIQQQTGEIIDYIYEELESIGNSTTAFSQEYVLYSKLRPYLNKVVLPIKSGYCTSELIPLLPDSKCLNKYYLAHLLRYKSFVEFINIKVAGAKMPRVSMNDFWGFSVILPPLPLQQQFASKIEAIEKMKSETKKALQEAETLFNARMDYWFN